MISQDIFQKIASARIIRLFLDYDGTLARFAPTPDTILMDEQLISLMKCLVVARGILPAVISGRKLAHIQKLLPIPGLLLGGSYGIDIQMPDGRSYQRESYGPVRAKIEGVLPLWQELVSGREDFYLEDKGWTVALHHSPKTGALNQDIMAAAYSQVKSFQNDSLLKVTSNSQFLEIAPIAASKQAAFKWILDNLTPSDALPISIGDDEHDEEAFAVIHQSGGISLRVTGNPENTSAVACLQNPEQVREWLTRLVSIRAASLS